MEKARKPTAMIWVAFLVAGCALFAVFTGLAYLYIRQRNVQRPYPPPEVSINQPAADSSIPSGTFIVVSATARGMRPIVRIELWMDGALQEMLKSERSEGVTPFYADFGLLIPSEGAHMLFVRAVDAAGLIGQSPAVGLAGVPKPAEAYMAVQVQAGETLDQIAAAQGVQKPILQELNPGLGNSPPAGSTVKVPAPPDEGGEAGPAAPPPAPSGNSAVQIPNTQMMQIASERSIGLLPLGPFIPEPNPGNASSAPDSPAAPSDLQAEVKSCKVTLRWNDNAKNEENYYVYVVPVTFHGFAVPFATLKPSPSTGPAWYEFQPEVGGAVSIWVEAANSYSSQPSNTVWVFIPYVSGCPATVAHQLNISFLDMAVDGNFDRAYCYVSFENTPEQRVPLLGGDFIQLQGGKSQGPINRTFNITIPNHRKIDLSGDCWAWSGSDLSDIGEFKAALALDTWNGERQTLKGNGFQIGISITPTTVMGTGNTGVESIDPTLPAPYDVLEEPLPSGLQASYPLGRTLRWKWDGDLNKVDSFEIFLNGQPAVKTMGTIKEKEYPVLLPGECGQPVRWQVAVRVGTAISSLSAPFQYDLPPCQTYLRVRFNDIYLSKTDDGFPGDACDTLDTYFEISVGDTSRSFWNSNFFIPLKCGGHMFSDMTGGNYPQIYGPEPNVITIPLYPGEDVSALWIKARFWDSDEASSDDLFASFAEHPLGVYIPQLGERWTNPSINPLCAIDQRTGWSIFDEARSSLSYTYSVYPNTCKDTLPSKGFGGP
jgi:LysM repeat protein